MKTFIVFIILSSPVVAYASTGAEQSLTSIALQAINLVVNAYVASEIAPLKKRVKTLEDLR